MAFICSEGWKPFNVHLAADRAAPFTLFGVPVILDERAVQK